MLKQAHDQVIASRKRKVLNLWVGEYDKLTKEQGASYMVKFSNLH